MREYNIAIRSIVDDVKERFINKRREDTWIYPGNQRKQFITWPTYGLRMLSTYEFPLNVVCFSSSALRETQEYLCEHFYHEKVNWKH